MDEFKPEDELKPDPSDRRTGRSRQSSDRDDNEPQINFDDVDLDADDRRPSRSRNARDEREEEDYESDDESVDEESVERRPRKRKKVAAKPASRQYVMMGLGVFVLLLLIIGIGSALKAPSTPSNEQTASTEKSINLSGNNNDAADQANGVQPAPGTTSAEQTAGNPTNAPQDVSLPPVSATPTQGQASAAPEGQQRVEVQGDLNNALTQNQDQVNNVVANSTLPTEPATVAPIRGGNAQPQTAATETKPRQTQAATSRPERQKAVIEPKRETKPQTVAKATEAKPVAQPKPTETATSTPVKTPVATAAPKVTAATPAPAATASTSGSASGKSSGNVGAMKAAPSNNYTLQLSSSSNYDNLNNWAKKSNLKNYVVYQSTRISNPVFSFFE